jgi:hypothetical protein
VDERLEVLGTRVLYLVSDRAKALIQLAEKGLACLSMPDFFHFVHDIVKSYALTISRRLGQAQKDLKQAEAMRESHRSRGPRMALGQRPRHRWKRSKRR